MEQLYDGTKQLLVQIPGQSEYRQDECRASDDAGIKSKEG